MFIAVSVGVFTYAAYRLLLAGNDENNFDEKTIKIPRNYKWGTPKHSWKYQRAWIPEQLSFIFRKTTQIKYDRKEVNRKFNKILLQELTIDASYETEIELVDANQQNDLIGSDSLFSYAVHKLVIRFSLFFRKSLCNY